MKRLSRRTSPTFAIEPLQQRKLLAAALSIPLNPVNERPITDPDYTLIPSPRMVLGKKGTLEVFAPNTDDQISINIRQINGANRVVVQVNDRSRAVLLRDVKRFTIVGDAGYDNPQFFPQRGADRISIAGPDEFLKDRRVTIYGDNVEPAEARVDNAGNTFNFDGGDHIVGTAFNDVIIAGGGNNYVEAAGGNDRVSSLEGRDTMGGGAGNDTVQSGEGQDEISGGPGNDSLDGGNGPDTVAGGPGNDFINLGTLSSGDILNFGDGGAGNDTINGSNADDIIYGGEGDDSLDGSFSNDSILAGPGNDTILGGVGFDTLYGEDGNDDIFGDQGVISGRDQPIEGDISDDTIYGNAGDDYLWGESGNDKVSGGDGNDWVLGQFGEDDLDGGTGNDYLNGHEGNDRVVGGRGRDTYNLADFEARQQVGFKAGQTDYNTNQDNPNREVRPYRLTKQIDGPNDSKDEAGRFDLDL